MIALIIISGLVITGNFVCFHVCLRQEKKILDIECQQILDRHNSIENYEELTEKIKHLYSEQLEDREANIKERTMQLKRHTLLSGDVFALNVDILKVNDEVKSLDSTVNVLTTNVLELQKVAEGAEDREAELRSDFSAVIDRQRNTLTDVILDISKARREEIEALESTVNVLNTSVLELQKKVESLEGKSHVHKNNTYSKVVPKETE